MQTVSAGCNVSFAFSLLGHTAAACAWLCYLLLVKLSFKWARTSAKEALLYIQSV